MGIKAYFFSDEECGRRCDVAKEKIQQYIDTGEIEEMSIQEGLGKFDLGEPVGVPFIGIIAESTGECITQIYFDTEEPGDAGKQQ